MSSDIPVFTFDILPDITPASDTLKLHCNDKCNQLSITNTTCRVLGSGNYFTVVVKSSKTTMLEDSSLAVDSDNFGNFLLLVDDNLLNFGQFNIDAPYKLNAISFITNRGSGQLQPKITGTLVCPPSYSGAVIQNVVSCQKVCTRTDRYSLERGNVSVINGEKFDEVEFVCKLCPNGANCTEGITAAPNYWGTTNNDTGQITMHRCPFDYCCQDNETCLEIDSCNTGRIGTLCGHCEPGLTELLLVPTCVSNCSSALGFFLYILLAVAVAIFFVLKGKVVEDWIPSIRKYCAESNCNGNKNQQMQNAELSDIRSTTRSQGTEDGTSQTSREGGEKKQETGTGSSKYLVLFLFYLQDTDLFKVLLPGEKGSASITTQIMTYVLEIFDASEICFSPMSTPILKQYFLALFYPCVVFFIFVAWAVLFVVQKYSGKNPLEVWARFLLEGFLLTYITALQNVARGFSLSCKSIEDNSVVFIEGDVDCNSRVASLPQVVPILAILAFWCLILSADRVKKGHFPVSFFIMFSIPVVGIILLIIYLLVKYYRNDSGSTARQANLSDTELTKCKKVIVETLIGDYWLIWWWWPYAFFTYRMILVLAASSEDIGMRLVFMPFMVFIFLIEHILLQPYREKGANFIGTLYYIGILAIAMINVGKFVASYFGCKEECDRFKQLLSDVTLFETLLQICFPCLMGVGYLFVKAFPKLLFLCDKGKKKYHEFIKKEKD